MKDYKVDKESIFRSFRKEVYEVVSQIPVGKVSTYGGIALLLGGTPMLADGGACFERSAG